MKTATAELARTVHAMRAEVATRADMAKLEGKLGEVESTLHGLKPHADKVPELEKRVQDLERLRLEDKAALSEVPALKAQVATLNNESQQVKGAKALMLFVFGSGGAAAGAFLSWLLNRGGHP
jgi:polyhydroxyalkanoate synthesis regulator phasin